MKNRLLGPAAAFALALLLAPTAAMAQPLAGRAWTPVMVAGAKPVPGQELTFDRDNNVFGSDGCNRFRGAATLRGEHGLRFGRMMSTLMACAEPRKDRASRAFNKALELTRSWRIKGNRLTLLDGRGRQIAIFRR